MIEQNGTTTELETQKAELEKKVEKLGIKDLDRRIEIAMAALRCPPADKDITSLSGVCVLAAHSLLSSELKVNAFFSTQIFRESAEELHCADS